MNTSFTYINTLNLGDLFQFKSKIISDCLFVQSNNAEQSSKDCTFVVLVPNRLYQCVTNSTDFLTTLEVSTNKLCCYYKPDLLYQMYCYDVFVEKI